VEAVEPPFCQSGASRGGGKRDEVSSSRLDNQALPLDLRRAPWPRGQKELMVDQPLSLGQAASHQSILAPHNRLRACTDRWQRCQSGMALDRTPFFASVLAASLSHLRMWLSSRPSNLSSSSWTSWQYAAILALRELDSFITWSMNSYESPWTFSRRMPNRRWRVGRWWVPHIWTHC
jgi:hypothetical protein